MTNRQKAELDALHRMQVFVHQNGDALGTVMQAPSRTGLDDAVTALETQAGSQSAALVYATSQTTQKFSAREDLRLHHMNPIAAIARISLAGTPQIIDLRTPRKNIDDVRLVAAANGMAQAAALYTQVFIDHKLPADFIAQLEAATAVLQATIATRNKALQQVKAATQTVADQTTTARNVVRVLSALVVKQLKGRTDLLAAWHMAKQINAKPGVPRGKKKPVPTPTPVPAPTPTLSPVVHVIGATPVPPSTSAAAPAEPTVPHAA